MVTTSKLLLADDSATIRKVVELTFADEGVEVFAVGDGDAAMQKFIQVQPDIVLVDVEMPGPNGYQICEMIKQDEATCNIPVLLLVGSFEPFDQDEAERVHADGFLTKPFQSIRDLVARVNELLIAGEPQLAAGPETEDIEDLYVSSFADTLPLDEYDTEKDLFDGESFKIGSAETVSNEAGGYSPHHDPFAEPLRADDDDEALLSELAPPDEAVVTEGLPDPSAKRVDHENTTGASNRVVGFEVLHEKSRADLRAGDEATSDRFDDEMFDDEMIETIHLGDKVNSGGEPFVEETVDSPVRSEAEVVAGAGSETHWDFATEAEAEAEGEGEPEPTQSFETEASPSNEPEKLPIKDFDWSPAAKIVDEPDDKPTGSTFEPRFVFADAETLSGSDLPQQSETAQVPNDTLPDRATEDVINLIAQRVLEKLSDRVIREVARDAVPRIAEKLIREALEEESKP